MANQIIVTQNGNVQVSVEPTPNVQVQISRAAITTLTDVPTANFANYAGNVTVANQPNITSIGALANLSVTNTATIGNLVVTGNLSVGNLVANNANYANFAGVANTANAVAVANVTGIGNIAVINLDGNVSNVLSGNGTFVPLPTVSANANYANFAGTAFNVSGSNVTGAVANATYANAANTANLATYATTANSVAGANVSGTVANATYAESANTANSATVASSANSVAVANVVGIGNIATTNYDGNVANILHGDGSWGPEIGPQSVANANYANFAGTAYSVSGSNVVGAVANATYAESANTANLATYATTANSVAGANVSGQVANALVAGTVYTNAQPNITSVGTLTSLAVAGNITGVDVLSFDTANGTGTLTTGQLSWDATEQTLSLGMNNGVTQQIGLENYVLIKASSAITDGQVVMFTGANGDNVLGAPCDTTSVGFRPEYVIGIATQNIALNGFGYVTVFGSVHGLNTNAYNVGDILWVDPTTVGGLTATQPTDPNVQIEIAAVTKKSGGDGHIQVRVSVLSSLTTLTDVTLTSPTVGQALVYNGSNIWINGNPNQANYATVANSVAVANVVGIGNIATVNLDGSSSNVLYGNGQWATISIPSGTSISNGTSNISIPTANANILISTAGNANIVDIWAQGTLNLKPPAQGPLNAIRIDTYGRSGNTGAQRISSFRYRGNATTPLSVQPGDATMELLTVGSNGTAAQTNSIGRIQAIVDSSYTANGANIPLGWQIQVNDTNGGVNNQLKTHNFYANGNVNFANSVVVTDNLTATIGNITATSGVFTGNGAGLTNLPAGNVTGNFTYLNVVDSANVTGAIQQLAPNNITITTNSLQNTAYNLTTLYGETSNIVDVAGRTTIRSRGNVSTPATVVSGDTGFRERVYFYNGTTNALAFTTSVTLSNLNSNSNAYTTGASYNISVGAPSGDQGNANAASALNLLQFNNNGQLVILPGGTSTAGTGLQMYGYGQNTNLAQAQGITMTKARGNRDANLSVQANDTIGRVVFQPHNGTGVVTNRLAIIRASVDSSYVANTANVPVGIAMTVCDNTTSYTHNFYANGTYTAPGAVTIPSGNLTMGPSQTIEVNRINQTGAGPMTIYGPTTIANAFYNTDGATFSGNSDVSITGSSNGTPKNFYIGDFTNGNLNMSINGNLTQSKGNVFLSTSNIFIYDGGNSINMNAVSDSANGKYANVTFDYGQFNEGLSTGGNLNVTGALSIGDLNSGNLTVGSYSNPHSNTASLWADVGIKGNVTLSGYDFFSNTYSPLTMQFGYGNVSLQILDGNLQVSNANGNGGYISTVNLNASGEINVGPGNALIYANGQANVANIQISANGFTKLSTYTSSALTAITGQVGWMAAVTNSTPGGMLAYWDTTNSRWSYVHDNSAV